MKIGFTGTRKGMTIEQLITVKKLILEHIPGYGNQAHHGDCVGSDAEFHNLVRRYSGAKIIGHPGFSAKNPDDTRNRAFCEVDELRKAKTYFARNRDNVNETDLLIATPPTMEELENGGTWYTINFSRKQKKPRIIVWPDGSLGE